jgi:hypothetical protein
MYPALPQVNNMPYRFNTMRLTLTSASNHRVVLPRLSVTATMVDMKMTPITVVAKRAGTSLVAKIVIPMFGTYRLTLRGRFGGRSLSGQVKVPITFL